MSRFKVGDTAYILESNRIVKEVKIIRQSGGIYLIRFNTGGGIQVKEHRLYATQEEAEAAIPGNTAVSTKRRSSPYDFDH
ncbi:MAG: hypothetical protein PHT76_12135 [Anaerostipes sp.]|nr:hypothetical protein [Anaerostipes sp.]